MCAIADIPRAHARTVAGRSSATRRTALADEPEWRGVVYVREFDVDASGIEIVDQFHGRAEAAGAKSLAAAPGGLRLSVVRG